MDSNAMDRSADRSEEKPASETPEDVAILYSWANLHGAKYRDFSASRREYRAQLRHRAAEHVRELELKAQAEAEAAAEQAEQAAHAAEAAARGSLGQESYREDALRAAEEASRKAAAERIEATRRAEAAAAAEAAAHREEREMASAHASAQRQAARYTESEARLRELAGPQPASILPGSITDPYTPQQTAPIDYDRDTHAQEAPSSQSAEERRRPQGFRPDESSGYRRAFRATPDLTPYATPRPGPRLAPPRAEPARAELRPEPAAYTPSSRTGYTPLPEKPAGPAWLYAPQTAPRPAAPAATLHPRANTSPSPVADTLQHSRERVAARWFALKGVFDQPGGETPEVVEPARQKEAQVPMVAIFSLAGGVGKTSLVATLGRTLSSLGERVILADTTSHGLLPFYFGASELRPGVVRTFSPPSGSMDAPISLVSYDISQAAMDPVRQTPLIDEFIHNGRGSQRMIVDLTGSSGWIIRRLARVSPRVLIPVAPDMNSVISLQSVEKFFQNLTDGDGRPVQPTYLLNQFDASLPLHLDVREVLRRQLGDRLLPFVIRRSPSVSEALAEGMTVVDYAPDTPIAEDYLNVANWLRTVSAPASTGLRNVRWSER